MPVPEAFERRYALRRRAVEIIGALEATGGADPEAAAALTAELVTVARDAAGLADEARTGGSRSGHAAGREPPLAGRARACWRSPPCRGRFSHSQFRAYPNARSPTPSANVYRVPTDERKGYFEFGTAIHAAFETFTVARREARAAGLPDPGFEALESGFAEHFKPAAFPDAQAAEHYRVRSGPTLRRFFDRELASTSEALLFETHFLLELDPGDGSEPVRVAGRHRPDRSAPGRLDRSHRLQDRQVEEPARRGRGRPALDVCPRPPRRRRHRPRHRPTVAGAVEA